MFSFGYMDRKWRIIKDVCFIAIAVVLILRTGFFGILVGALALVWYGRDLYVLLRAAKLEKDAQKVQTRTQSPPEHTSEAQDGKITVTDLSGAKEVDFKKE